jgi:hypothetical protein
MRAEQCSNDIGQEILNMYSSTVRKLSDEALITIHQEHLRVQADELVEITWVELDRRGLLLDENCLCSN